MAKAQKRAAEAWDYVLKSDRDLPKEEQSRFTLRPMTMAEQAAYHDAVRSGGGGSRIWQATVAVCPEHITAVHNFPAGAAKEWPKERAAQLAYLEDVGVDECFEIGDEIYARSKLGPEVKN